MGSVPPSPLSSPVLDDSIQQTGSSRPSSTGVPIPDFECVGGLDTEIDSYSQSAPSSLLARHRDTFARINCKFYP